MNAHRKDTMKKETSAAAVDEEWDRRLRHGRDRTPRRIDETLGRHLRQSRRSAAASASDNAFAR